MKKKHRSICPKCGTEIEHIVDEPNAGYAPCPKCHCLLKFTGSIFFELVELDKVPAPIYASYKRYLDEVTSQRLAAARAAGPKIVGT